MIGERRLPAAMLIVAAATAPVAAQDAGNRARQDAAQVLTVEQAVREAVNRNLNLFAERFNLGVADTAILTASLRPNPVITANLMLPDRLLVDAGISPYEQVFRGDYVIERGAKRDRRIDQATLSRSVAELQLLNATRTLILDVESAFVDVQLAKLNLNVAETNLLAFNDVVQINIDRVRAGDLSAVELSRSRLAALQFQNDVRQQQTRLQVARNRLSTLVGRGPSGDRLDVTGELRRDSQPIDYEGLRARALAARPDVRAVRADQARSVADLRLQLANGKADYTVSGEYHRQEGAMTHGNSYGVFFSTPLPIFNRNQGEIARAGIQNQQLNTRVQAIENDVTTELTNAYALYTSTRAIVDAIERQMLVQAQDVRATTEYSYRRGEATFVEFLDAVRAFNETMQSYNEARAEYARSLYALDAIAGKVAP